MMNMLQTAGAFSCKAGRSIRNRSRGLVAIAAGAATIGAANAQGATNAGIAEVVDAINDLKPDLGFVVTAAILVALVGIGAAIALAIGKRLMGK